MKEKSIIEQVQSFMQGEKAPPIPDCGNWNSNSQTARVTSWSFWRNYRFFVDTGTWPENKENGVYRYGSYNGFVWVQTGRSFINQLKIYQNEIFKLETENAISQHCGQRGGNN